MGEGFANAIMFALLAGAAIFLVMFLVRRFRGSSATPAPAYAGMGGGAAAGGAQVAWPQAAPAEKRAFDIATPAPVTPAASADATQAATQPALAAGAAPAAAAAPISGAFVPAAFDSEGFARTAKMIFIRLQTANDTADLDDLRKFTTPELFASIRLDIQERGATPQQTDVLKVEAEVLDVADEADRQVVSVRFHGQVVEEKGGAPVSFNEVWHLVKPHDDSRAWAIAGIEQMA